MDISKLPTKDLQDRIWQFLRDIGVEDKTFDAKLISEMIYSSCRLYHDQHNTAQLKLINHSLREMRYAFKVFNQFPPEERRLSIFGSARTPEDHPDYMAAKDFSTQMSKHEWMCITGAAGGIMKAGHEGSTQEAIFGLSIDLTFESGANVHIEGDPKHINFKYFFTRKLMFLAHSDAIAIFPGGFGTMDELFEVLTLIQTGKSGIVPLVLLEGAGGTYWDTWLQYVEANLIGNKTINAEDKNLFYQAPTVEDAVDHIQKFYSRYHSSRYVKDLFVIRMLSPLTSEQVESLNAQYSMIIKSGKIEQGTALPQEDDALELPRLIFHFTGHNFATLRQMIDQINDY
ncbi:MAG: hypothetical protein K940chlam3_00870 [Chlamydiae bacterium]|nr:hypothetical protein [Chlamydiota bacterium]